MEKCLIYLNGKCLLSEKGMLKVLIKNAMMALSQFPPKASRGERKEQDKMIGEGERRLSQVGLMMKEGGKVRGKRSLERVRIM